MKRAPLDYAVSLLLAPIICIAITLSTRQDTASEAARLGNRLNPVQYDQFQSTTGLLLTVATVVLAVSILLPMLFVLLMRRLGNDRDALASAFAPLVRTYLVCAAVVLVAQGCGWRTEGSRCRAAFG